MSKSMSKRIVAVNAGSRMGWNTETLITEASSSFVGPTEVLVSGDTLQLKDYSKTDWQWTLFDPESKQKRHDTVFPEECKKAFEMGAGLV